MTDLLIRLFLRGEHHPRDPHMRAQYGLLSGVVGIVLNLLLAVTKLLAGLFSSSLAITADALNNFTDAGSSLVTLVGFRMAGQRPDASHPFGHGRIEYLAGLIVSLLILLVGVELIHSSIRKIITPQAVQFSWILVVILVVSICVKLWMSLFNSTLAVRIQSAAMKATAVDSLSDVLATAAVLAGLLIGHFFQLYIDGWIGMLVAILILRAGLTAARDTLNPLLGQNPKPELVTEIERIALSYPEVLSIHDLVIHDYGPGRAMMSFHAEVPSGVEIMRAHDAIDLLERELKNKFNIITCIHMDPIATDDDQLIAIRAQIARMVREIHPDMTIHDFRMTNGPNHSNLIFDVVVPYQCGMTDDALRARIAHDAKALNKSYYTVVEVDHSFTNGL